MRISRAALALDKVLKDKEIAARLTKRVHRTALWRYRRGMRLPSVSTAATIEQLTDGAVPATEWAKASG